MHYLKSKTDLTPLFDISKIKDKVSKPMLSHYLKMIHTINGRVHFKYTKYLFLIKGYNS